MSDPQKRVLLVDDDADFIFQQKTMLEAAGFGVITAGGRSEAEEILQAHEPDLAVVDLMMEHMDDGFALCHYIKSRRPAMPVIMVTGVTHETGMEFGHSDPKGRNWIKADAILAKPIRFEQLMNEISRLCG